MKSGDKNTRPMLTASQLKALLVVASDSRLETAPASDAGMADVEALLADMSRATRRIAHQPPGSGDARDRIR